MPVKTHRSALAVVPPEEVWGPVQEVRRRHDRQFGRWMPHVNLLYAFRPRGEFPAIAPAVAAACASVAPFVVTLGRFGAFRYGSGRCTLWLARLRLEGAVRRQRPAAAFSIEAGDSPCDNKPRRSLGSESGGCTSPVRVACSRWRRGRGP